MIFYSSIEPVYFMLPVLGLIIGFFSSMLGGGGGFFFLPIMTLLLKVPPQVAVITSLVATLPICIAGSFSHYRRSNIDFRIAAIFTVAGIAGAFIGAGITSIISSNELKVSFGTYSMLLSFNLIIGTWKRKRKNKDGNVQKNTGNMTRMTKGSFFGLFAGIVTGTFGTSGTAPVLAGLFSMHIPLKRVIGTSLMVVLINTFFAVGAHFLIGQIDMTLVLFLTAGSTIGALTGPRLLTNVKSEHSENKFRYIYATVMGILGFLMIIG